MFKYSLLVFALLISTNLFSQNSDPLKIVSVDSVAIKKALKKQAKLERREARKLKNVRPYNALAPTKATFYSAILPGLGQAYTGSYWKIPIVYGALGTGIGIALWNDRKADEFREIYKNRLLGIYNDKYWNQETQTGTSNETLAAHAEKFEQNKELSVLITLGLYVLNIIDANITAHLQQYNIDKKLTLNPNINLDEFTTPNYGLSLSYIF